MKDQNSLTLEMFLPELSIPFFFFFLKSSPAEVLQRYIDRPKTLKRAHIGEGLRSLNSITTALYTIHRRQRCTGCSFQLLFPQIPIEISFGRTMHFFPFEKKERKSISGFNTCGNRSIPALALFFSATLFLQFFPPSLANGK